ncbi:MAG TPA: 2OG-Fe(II) oxygenase [Phenylobacterium sp.]|uniref:2OG-Fe(II) oxygenase n=1 Tax=Phenylobacterium sp. TaxID=1871053 RepID=UPI002B492890|nr:2OG-Fe(II) oxygenase [Phenylobacterium sp.]HKR89274.1 2OG-Fe(II) oxygenase [Phenylobacterium sp.]
MPLKPGEPAPWFRGSTPSYPQFTFDSVAGRYILLAFLPRDDAPRLVVLKALAEHRPMFDDARLSCFAVVRDPQTAAGAQDMTGLRWVLDLDGAVSVQFADQSCEPPAFMVLDPTLRLLRSFELDEIAALFGYLAALPPPAEHGGAPGRAPVLIAPRIFEPELCERLIALHAETAGQFTGVMRDRGERTHYVMDELKSRRDVLVADPALQAEIRERLEGRLFPLMERAFCFRPTRIERYLVSCYDVADGGVFHAHRDNTTFGTAHRKFAGSINLNADFAGGDLRFAEFGRDLHRPPVGGACVFACGLLHEATKVTAGRRYAFLPFFYDEAGAAALAAYQARVAASSPDA